jgi:quercetin dioxygenase-like cupin family protein
MEEFAMNMHRVHFADMPWITAMAGARYKVFKHGGRQLRLVEFTKDFVEPDWCLRGHIGYVLEGEMEIDFNGDIVTYFEGDGLFIPPGEHHKHIAKVLTDYVRLVMVEDI